MMDSTHLADPVFSLVHEARAGTKAPGRPRGGRKGSACPPPYTGKGFFLLLERLHLYTSPRILSAVCIDGQGATPC